MVEILKCSKICFILFSRFKRYVILKTILFFISLQKNLKLKKKIQHRFVSYFVITPFNYRSTLIEK